MNVDNKTIFSEQLFFYFSDLLAPYLSLVGLTKDVLTDPTIAMPEEKFIELLEHVALHGDPNIGLTIGRQVLPEHIGAFGHALISAPSVKDFLNVLSDFIITYSHLSAISWLQTKYNIEISYQVNDPTIESGRQDAEFSISAVVKMLSQYAGTSLRLQRIDFKHPKPKSTTMHTTTFNCPVFFLAPSNKIIFNNDILNYKSPKADSRLFHILIAHLENQKKLRQIGELNSQLNCLIAAQLHLGEVTIGRVSKMLGISVRTLQRRLSEDNLEFSAVLLKIRQQLALNYIKDPSLSILQIAEKLGYHETSSFTRAFKRWTGFSPKNYRDL